MRAACSLASTFTAPSMMSLVAAADMNATSSSASSANCNATMNNGLSNGHDQHHHAKNNLVDIELCDNSSPCAYSSPSHHPSSTDASTDPVSSSNHFGDNAGPLKMGLLKPLDKNDMPPNLIFFKANKTNNQILPQVSSSTTPTIENSQENQHSVPDKPPDDQCQPQQQTKKDSPSLSCEPKEEPKKSCVAEEVSSPDANISTLVCAPCSFDSVPIESIRNDLLKEHHSLCKKSHELMRRIRRLQIQHTHRNVVKQMKTFVTRQQKVTSVGCQQFNFEFSPFITSAATSTDSNSHLKALLRTHDITKSEKLVRTDLDGSSYVLNYRHQQPSLYHLSLPTNSSVDTLTKKFSPNKTVPAPLSQYELNCATKTMIPPSQVSLSNVHTHSMTPFVSDVQASLPSFSRDTKTLTVCNNTAYRTISQESKEKLLSTIDTLRYNVRHLESKYDSDATDSSSGGESCDELEDYEPLPSTSSVNASSLPSSSTSGQRPYFPIRNRSSWKWCTERSAIASRWSWLYAQINDLETKMRAQNEIFRQMRETKGYITFGDNIQNRRQFPPLSTVNNVSTATTSNHTTQVAAAETATTTNLQQQPSHASSSSSSSQVSGNNTSLVETVSSLPSNEVVSPSDEESDVCMRTIPFVSMKKRKLIRSEPTLSMAIKQEARYSSIQCSCNIYPPFVAPCVICNGRYNYMHSIDTEFMPYFERVSLLDSSCHPVLCLPNDIPLGIHFMQLLKQETIFSKPSFFLPNKKKRIQLNSLSVTPTNASTSVEHKLKKTTPCNNVITKSAKKKSDKPKKRRLSSESAKKPNRDRLSSGCSSRPDSPTPSLAPSETSSTGATPLQTPTTPSAPLQRRRRSEQHAFDINNIVIPYCATGGPRVERLQYKEILTPKWRINDEYSIPPPNPQQVQLQIAKLTERESDSEEDTSQSAFEQRHARCEEAERDRIMSFYVKNRKGAAADASKPTTYVTNSVEGP